VGNGAVRPQLPEMLPQRTPNAPGLLARYAQEPNSPKPRPTALTHCVTSRVPQRSVGYHQLSRGSSTYKCCTYPSLCLSLFPLTVSLTVPPHCVSHCSPSLCLSLFPLTVSLAALPHCVPLTLPPHCVSHGGPPHTQVDARDLHAVLQATAAENRHALQRSPSSAAASPSSSRVETAAPPSPPPPPDFSDEPLSASVAAAPARDEVQR
jgi:hypothetical protein